MADARALHRLLFLLLLAGLAASVYAAIEVLVPAAANACTVNALFSCSAVDQSGLTSIGPIPDWVIGVAGFGLMLAIDLPLQRTYTPRLLDAILLLSVAGLAVAAYLSYVEIFLIHALCPVCLSTYILDAGVLLVAIVLWRLRRAPEEGRDSAASELSA
jgi:uncharacterized membrane protein